MGRPLLLYPRPRTALRPQEDGPLLDLTDAAVRRMIKLAKKRGYITYGELDQVLPPDEFTPEQIEDVLSQLSGMGITVIEAEEGEEPLAAAPTGRGEEARDGPPELPVIHSSVFEGCWDGSSWRTSTGVPCNPTHWMPMPSPPLTLVRS
jgi:hypothetical protein